MKNILNNYLKNFHSLRNGILREIKINSGVILGFLRKDLDKEKKKAVLFENESIEKLFKSYYS